MEADTRCIDLLKDTGSFCFPSSIHPPLDGTHLEAIQATTTAIRSIFNSLGEPNLEASFDETWQGIMEEAEVVHEEQLDEDDRHLWFTGLVESAKDVSEDFVYVHTHIANQMGPSMLSDEMEVDHVGVVADETTGLLSRISSAVNLDDKDFITKLKERLTASRDKGSRVLSRMSGVPKKRKA